MQPLRHAQIDAREGGAGQPGVICSGLKPPRHISTLPFASISTGLWTSALHPRSGARSGTFARLAFCAKPICGHVRVDAHQ